MYSIHLADEHGDWIAKIESMKPIPLIIKYKGCLFAHDDSRGHYVKTEPIEFVEKALPLLERYEP